MQPSSAYDLSDLLQAICSFTPTLLEHFVAQDDDYKQGLAAYLSDGLSLPEQPVSISADDVKQWLAMTHDVQRSLTAALREPHDRVSSSENVLLALPNMDCPPRHVEAISELVADYRRIVDLLVKRHALTALRELAECGRRWTAIVEATVPIGQRFAVRLCEDRPLKLDKRQSWQRFALGDAESSYLQVRVSDANVLLGGRLACRDPLGNVIGPGLLDEVRLTSEAGSIYSAAAERPRFVDVEIKLRLTRDLRVMPSIVSMLAVAATGIALALPSTGGLIPALAVVAVPITVAAALLAVREQTALASRLQAAPRAWVVVLTVLLWSVVLMRLLWNGAALPPWHH